MMMQVQGACLCKCTTAKVALASFFFIQYYYYYTTTGKTKFVILEK